MKRDIQSFIFSSFSNSLNMKKTSSYPFVGLVKLKRRRTCHHDETELLLPRAHYIIGWIHPRDEIIRQAYGIVFKLEIKIKRYSLEIVLENITKHMSCILYERQCVTLEHDTYLYLMSGLGYPHFVTCLIDFSKSICLSFEYIVFSP